MRFITSALSSSRLGGHVYHSLVRLARKRASGCHLDMVDAVVGGVRVRQREFVNSVRDRVLLRGA